MKTRSYKQTYRDWNDLARDCYIIGNNEPTFTVTLSTQTAATVVSNPLVGINSFIGFMPTSSTAAAQLSTMAVTNRGIKTFTISHLTATGADKTFVFFVHG